MDPCAFIYPDLVRVVCSFFPIRDLWMWGMTPPPAMVALISVSNSSSPLEHVVLGCEKGVVVTRKRVPVRKKLGVVQMHERKSFYYFLLGH